MRTLIVTVIVAMLLATCSGHPWAIKEKFRRARNEVEQKNGGNSGGQNNGSNGGSNGGSSNGGSNGGSSNGGSNGGSSNGGSNGGSSNGGSNGGSSNGGSSQAGAGGMSSMNPDQWLSLLQNKCGHLDLSSVAANKVTPMEVMNVLADLYYVVDDAADNFTTHSGIINNLTNSLSGNKTLSELVTSHTIVVTHFLGLVASAADESLCPFGHLNVLMQRLQFIGGDGFSEVDSCDKSFLAIKALKTQHGSMANAYSSIDAAWLHAFGGHIREDMTCINEDIRKFEDHIEEILDNHYNAHNGEAINALKMRDVQLEVATINAYAGILEREIRRLHGAVSAVGTALDHIDITALEAGGSRDLSRILQLLKLLQTA